MDAPSTHPTRFRWVVCGLLFLATAANYADRGFFGNLAPELQARIGWSASQYWYMQGVFFAAYAASYLFSGRMMDALGLRVGFPLAVGFWSLALMSHALVGSVAGLFCARALLGIGEGGNFPAAVKATAEWFPRRERALAGGIFNAGCNVGALVVPIGLAALMPWLDRVRIGGHVLGWRGAFLLTGLVNVAWIFAWLALYRRPEEHPRASAAELALIRSDPPEPEVRLPWGRLVGCRETWAFALPKFLTDCMSWFYLVGSPVFLASRFGMGLQARGPLLSSIYLVAAVGSVAGGGLSGRLLRRGWSLNRARKAALLLCVLAVLPVGWAAYTSSYWVAVGLIALAYSAHQAWAATMWMMIPDLFPRSATGSVAGFAGMTGAVGAIVLFVVFGMIQARGAASDYRAVFLTASAAYPAALLALQWLSPRLEPARVRA